MKIDYRAFYHSREWRQLRNTILQRDHYTCCMCGFKSVPSSRLLVVDHIVEIRDDYSRRLDPSNLRVLCLHCNERRHSGRAGAAKRRAGGGGVAADGTPLDSHHLWNQVEVDDDGF